MFMNNNKQFPPIHIHPIVFFFFIIAAITGMLVEWCIIFFIVFIHELGHFLCARYYGWKIKRIYLWIFGGVMEVEKDREVPMKEEWLVIISGPLQHVILFFFFSIIGMLELLPDQTIQIAMYYNLFILLGNLIPILPLDGGKMLHLLCQHQFPYYIANCITIVISVLLIVLTCSIAYVTKFLTLSLFMLFIFLFWENRLEWKRRHYTFWHFLLLRCTALLENKRQQVIFSESQVSLFSLFRQFYRNRNNVIWINGRSEELSERDCLHFFLKNKNYHITLKQIMDEKKEVDYG